MACLSLSSPGSDAIDPQTKAHISSTFMPPPDLFRRGEDFVNYTSKQLIETRRNKQESDELLKNIKIASPKDIEKEIGVTEEESVDVDDEESTDDVPVEEPIINEIETPIDQSTEQIDKPAEDFPITEIPQQKELLDIPAEQVMAPKSEDSQIPKEINPMEEDEMVANGPKKNKKTVDLSRVVSNSLGTLIKIAKDLDIKGKYDASEEVHKIIRKYQKGL
jgi:hypothetical protein